MSSRIHGSFAPLPSPPFPRANTTGALGPIVVSTAIVVGGVVLFARRSREGAAPGVVPAPGASS